MHRLQSVPSQSVTNASLDAWRGHSSLLSPGHSMPLRQLLLTHSLTHACVFTRSRSGHSYVLYKHLQRFCRPFSSANNSTFTVNSCSLRFRFLNFSLLCNFSQINSTCKRARALLAVEHTHHVMWLGSSTTHTLKHTLAIIDSLDFSVD